MITYSWQWQYINHNLYPCEVNIKTCNRGLDTQNDIPKNNYSGLYTSYREGIPLKHIKCEGEPLSNQFGRAINTSADASVVMNTMCQCQRSRSHQMMILFQKWMACNADATQYTKTIEIIKITIKE